MDKGEYPPATALSDTVLVAFLALKGHRVKAWINREDGRVVFEILGDENQLNESMDSFYANEQVGIQDFNRKLKDVKSQMYNMKKNIKGEEAYEGKR
jgi:hypothetical protein